MHMRKKICNCIEKYANPYKEKTMNTNEIITYLKNTDEETLHSYISTAVFEDIPPFIGEIVNSLNDSDEKEIKILRETVTCIMLYVLSTVDSKIRSGKAEIPNPSEVAQYIHEQLEFYYKESKINPSKIHFFKSSNPK